MKIAIHNRPSSYSDYWINYCSKNNIPYKVVNCYDSDIVEQLSDCNGLMWHWVLWDNKAIQFARQLTYSLEQAGKKVFPNSQTAWHYDDKLGQKYLFESLKINAVPTWVFYDKNSALKWIKTARFPKVHKLRGGAGSVNVRLVKTPAKAKILVHKAFGKGFKVYNTWNQFYDRLLRFEREKSYDAFIHLLKGIVRLFVQKPEQKSRIKDKGYIYFQNFIPGNSYDIRLIVIGNRCFGIKRHCRKNDFRASGSGIVEFDPQLIDLEIVNMAFEIARKLSTQSLALDFIKENNTPVITEISYCFTREVFEMCPGYWDRDLMWHKKNVLAQRFMIEDFIDEVQNTLENKEPLCREKYSFS